MRRNGCTQLVMIVVLSLCAASATAASEDYERLLDAALAAQDSEDYTRAHALFAEAHALQPNARTLRAQGVASYRAGQIARAVRELEQALLHPVKPLDDELRNAVSELLERARAQLAVVVLQVLPEGAQVNVDEESDPVSARGELALDAGPHELHFGADGYVAERRQLQLSPGTRTVVPIALEPLPAPVAEPGATPPEPAQQVSAAQSTGARDSQAASGSEALKLRRRRAAWGLGGVAVGALLAAGAVFRAGSMRVEQIASACRNRDGGGCSPRERDTQLARAHVERFELGTDVLLGAAAVALVGSAASAFWSMRSDRRVELNASARSVRVRVLF